MRTASCFGLILLFATKPLGAADVAELPPAVVEVETPTDADLAVGTASVVTTDDATGTPKTLADVVQQLPGVHLRRSGALGGYSTLSLRGLGPENVRVVLDDIPLTSATLGPVDLSLLPAAGIDRVEVYRGSSPVRFDSPMGGVVRLVSKPASDRLTLSGHAGYGSWQTRSGHVAVSGPLGSLRASALVAYQGTQGRFRYYDDRETLYNQSDDVFRTRQNNALDAVHTRLTLEADGPNEGIAKFVAHGLWDQRGIPGPGAASPTTDANASERGLFARASLNDMRLSDGALGLTLAADGQVTDRRFRDPKREAGLQVGDVNSALARAAVESRVLLLENLTNETELAPRLSWDRYANENFGMSVIGAGRFVRQRLLASAGLEHRADLTARLRVVPSVRAEMVRDSGDDIPGADVLTLLSPRLGVLFDLGACQARASGGRFHRIPSTLERYGDGAGMTANLDLAPERGLSGDVGLRCKAEGEGRAVVEGDLVLYATRAHDLIVFSQNGALWLVADNVGESRIAGIEASASARARWARLEGTYTLTHARDASGGTLDDRSIPGIPEHRLTAALTLGPDWLSVRYEIMFSSRAYLDSANGRPMSDRLAHDLYANADLGGGIEVKGAVTNLTDTMRETTTVAGAATPVTTSKMDFLGYPLPGRSFFLSVLWRYP